MTVVARRVFSAIKFVCLLFIKPVKNHFISGSITSLIHKSVDVQFIQFYFQSVADFVSYFISSSLCMSFQVDASLNRLVSSAFYALSAYELYTRFTWNTICLQSYTI